MKSLTKTRKTGLAIGAGVIVVCMIVLIVVRSMAAQVETRIASKETPVEFGDLTVGVTESGSVEIGSVTQTFDLDLTTTTASTTASESDSSAGTSSAAGSTGDTLAEAASSTGSAADDSSDSTPSTGTAALIVEEVYVAAGQVVNAGDALMKLTDDSITDTREILTAAVTRAELSVKQATIDRDTAVLQAEYEHTANKSLGTTAEATYNATLNTLAQAVTSAQAALTEANTRIAEIPGEITTLQAELDALDQATAEGSTQAAELTREIESLESEQTNQTDQYDSLVSQLSSAKQNKITQTITAKEQYDQDLLNAQNADTLYEIAMNGIDDEIESTTETWEAAQENLAAFEAYVSTGLIASTCSGALTEVGYAAGDTLSANAALATFQDATAVTLSVSVAQDDISVVAVGDSVKIEFTAYEGVDYGGTVTAISSSTTDSRSSTVSYPVTVTLSGDVAAIYAGMTGNVTFITKEVTDVLYVSNKAISMDGTKSYVKLKNADGTTSQVEVTTGFSDGYQVEILSGLVEGDIVLIESQVSKT